MKFQPEELEESTHKVRIRSCCHKTGTEIWVNDKSIGFLSGEDKKFKINEDALDELGLSRMVEYY